MKNKLTNLTYFGVIVTISSVTFHVYYWTQFEINIFQYIPSSQLLISGIGPIIIPTLIYALISVINFIRFHEKIPYGGLSDLKAKLSENPDDTELRDVVSKLERKKPVVILLSFFPLLFNVAFYFIDYRIFYLFLPYNILIMSVFFTNILLKFELIQGAIDIRIVKLSLFMIIAAFSYSNLKSLEITKRDNFQYAEFDEQNYDVLLGKAGDYFFFQELNTGTTKIVNSSKLEKLELKTFDMRNLRTKEDSLLKKLIVKTHHNNR